MRTLVVRDDRFAPEPRRLEVFADVAEILDADPEVSDGTRLRLPFAVKAYRTTRL